MTVEAQRGLAAGSGLATTELRVVLLRLLDRIAAQFPDVKLSAYVDDIIAESTGSRRSVQRALSEAGTALCQGLGGVRLRLSPGKCKVISSVVGVGAKVATALGPFGGW